MKWIIAHKQVRMEAEVRMKRMKFEGNGRTSAFHSNFSFNLCKRKYTIISLLIMGFWSLLIQQLQKVRGGTQHLEDGMT